MRLPSGHRRYTAAQVRQLLLIGELLRFGYRAGDVVPQPFERLDGIVVASVLQVLVGQLAEVQLALPAALQLAQTRAGVLARVSGSDLHLFAPRYRADQHTLRELDIRQGSVGDRRPRCGLDFKDLGIEARDGPQTGHWL